MTRCTHHSAIISGTFSWSGEFVDMALDYRSPTEDFVTVTLPSSVTDTRGTLLSLIISTITLFGFRLLQRHRACA